MDLRSWSTKRYDCPLWGFVTRLGGMAVAQALVWSGHWQAGTAKAIGYALKRWRALTPAVLRIKPPSAG